MSGRNVQYIKQDEPNFLKDFKKKVGYVEGPDVNTKKEIAPPDFDDDDGQEEKEDEKPVVVVLKDGDLTATEAEQVSKNKEFLTDDGKVKFKKPVKRSGESDLNVSTKKKKDDEQKDKKDSSEKKDNKNTKKKLNKTLLSFGDEEEED